MWTELEQLSTVPVCRMLVPVCRMLVPVCRMLVPVRPSIFGTLNCFSRPEGVSIPKRQICNI